MERSLVLNDCEAFNFRMKIHEGDGEGKTKLAIHSLPFRRGKGAGYVCVPFPRSFLVFFKALFSFFKKIVLCMHGGRPRRAAMEPLLFIIDIHEGTES